MDWRAQLDQFPALLTPIDGGDDSKTSLLQAIAKNKSWIRQTVVDCGSVLLRGWKLTNGGDFADVVAALGYAQMNYTHGLAPRKHIIGPVFTANEGPVDVPIAFHNEMAYLPYYPDVIMFFCEQPSSDGGETALVDGQIVYKRLAKEMPDFLQLLEDKQLLYSSWLPEKWELMFHTTDKAEAQQRALAIGARLQWKNDVSQPLAYRGPFPATLKHPIKGSMAWFNSLNVVFEDAEKRYGVELGDGSRFPIEEYDKVRSILREEQVNVDWRKGDLVIVDNLSVMHSRLPGKAPRVVLASLATGH